MNAAFPEYQCPIPFDFNLGIAHTEAPHKSFDYKCELETDKPVWKSHPPTQKKKLKPIIEILHSTHKKIKDLVPKIRPL